MKIKLVHKFFAVFLITFFVIVGLMVAIIQIFAYRNFADYVGRMELEQLDGLAAELRIEYKANGGWQRIKNSDRLWREYLRIGFSRKERKTTAVDKPENSPPSSPPPGTSPGVETAVKHSQAGPRAYNRYRRFEHYNSDKSIVLDDPMDIQSRIALFDVHWQPVQGHVIKTDGLLLKEIKLDERIIGWLGLKKNEYLYHPLDVDYMRQQINILYYIGGGAIILTILVSLFLARHLLLPIRQLADGARNLTARNFKTEVRVTSQDELGQLAADFNKLAKTLDQYEQMRQQWISDISHELRTPLAVLRGEIEALIDGVRRTNTKTLASLHAEVIHISKIVNDLHSLSIAESGTLQFKNELIDPLGILLETLQLFESRLRKKEIECIHDLNRGFYGEQNGRPIACICGDRDRMIQLYTNLLENSLRYTASPGKIRITHQISKDRLDLHFEDTPPGVPQESLARIFDRLYRVDAARGREQGGSGLGLSICKHIVENHKGQIIARQSDIGGLKISIQLQLERRL